MSENWLFGNLDKCIFGADEVPAVGCSVGTQDVRADPARIKVIAEWPLPQSQKDLRRWLGLANYQHRYTANYAEMARTLSDLLKKDSKWVWTLECDRAFRTIAQSLQEGPILGSRTTLVPSASCVTPPIMPSAMPSSKKMSTDANASSQYNFTVVYKPGKLNVLLDALSCRPDYELAHISVASSCVLVGWQVKIPSSFKEAMSDQRFAMYWRAAMDEEMASLKQHVVWMLVSRKEATTRKAILTNKWVFAIKKDEHGVVKRFKARLVVHGFKIVFGVNYFETYAPVIRFKTIRVAIFLAIQRGWVIEQYDVKTAFLHGILKKRVYMTQPVGYEIGGAEKICLLVKSLYGLKQAPMVWNETLHGFLTSLGFTRVESDYGLYALHQEGEIRMLLTVYVDDLLLLGPPAVCAEIARKLQDAFELVHLGPVKYLLGVEVLIDRRHNMVMFTQEAYALEVLKRFGIENCHGVSTPESTTCVPIKVDNPSELPYPAISSRANDLVVYTDADYANDENDRRSISGYVTLLNGATIFYGSRKQGINALSTMEAEYIAMSEGVRDVLCKPGKHRHSKHIDNKYHFVRLLQVDGRIVVSHVGTNDMIADIMTKGLARVKFERFRDLLGVTSRKRFEDADLSSADEVAPASGGDEQPYRDNDEESDPASVLYIGFSTY
ncbi:hypothetical protein ATCC90586_002222 [Pythium insidiosum]|nr:hypothetical protein ATCC90586_002222 [Pythium insidiosum]